MDERQDRLYKLLPSIYRLKDKDQGLVLRELLRVMAEQANLVEDNIAQLYDNWFIETAEDWVVPYLGDLVGYEAVYEGGEPGDVNDRSAREHQRILTTRADVANTIRYRQQRGTLAVLELLAQDVAGWPARAVEFFRLLALTQAINHPRPMRGHTVDIRHGDRLLEIGGPFDQSAHTVDVRRINSSLTLGRYNLSNVGLFVWRLKVREVKRKVALMLDEQPNCFKFSILGNDVPLYLKPQPESGPASIADVWNLPVPIRRRTMDHWQQKGQLDRVYGEGKSLAIWAVYEEKRKPQRRKSGSSVQTGGSRRPELVSPEYIQIADLSKWDRVPKPPKVMVDPELGRIAFPEQLDKERTLVEVQVMYHDAHCAEIGGGTYSRSLVEPAAQDIPTTYRVGKVEFAAQDIPPTLYRAEKKEPAKLSTLQQALDQWKTDDPTSAVIEIVDSQVYEESFGTIRLREGQTLQIRAASQERPVIIIAEASHSHLDALIVEMERSCRLIFDGLLIAGRPLRVQGSAWADEQSSDATDERAMGKIILRHCTLVPGWLPTPETSKDSRPHSAGEPRYSLDLVDVNAQVSIEHCIVGSICVTQNEVATDPILIVIRDSIVDATHRELEAVGGSGDHVAHAVLRVERSTIIGSVNAHAFDLAENSIFDGQVFVVRRQRGCMRFCWYDAVGSRVPRRFNCQPDLVEAALQAPPDRLDRAKDEARTRLQPCFTSRQYGNPAYCQLATNCAEEIKTGADDLAEMGAYHDLYQPQRETNLRNRLEAFVPAGIDANIIFIS